MRIRTEWWDTTDSRGQAAQEINIEGGLLVEIVATVTHLSPRLNLSCQRARHAECWSCGVAPKYAIRSCHQVTTPRERRFRHFFARRYFLDLLLRSAVTCFLAPVIFTLHFTSVTLTPRRCAAARIVSPLLTILRAAGFGTRMAPASQSASASSRPSTCRQPPIPITSEN